ETLRGLLLGTHIGNNWWIALTWCLALSILGHHWSKTQFDRDPK
ncbi:ABC transporter permease, partial [Streptomyces fagopyri]